MYVLSQSSFFKTIEQRIIFKTKVKRKNAFYAHIKNDASKSLKTTTKRTQSTNASEMSDGGKSKNDQK